MAPLQKNPLGFFYKLDHEERRPSCRKIAAAPTPHVPVLVGETAGCARNFHFGVPVGGDNEKRFTVF